MQKLTRDEMAQRVARDIPEGAYVNLGIGLPTRIANYLPSDKEVFLHSENGLLGMGGKPQPGEEDPELINAGKEYVTLLKGGCFFHHGDSFAMMRGGHLDICVLGAYQVSARGDLANWSTGAPDAIPAVGGAMDLAIDLPGFGQQRGPRPGHALIIQTVTQARKGVLVDQLQPAAIFGVVGVGGADQYDRWQ